MPSGSSAGTWLAAAPDLRVRRWGDEAVVYDPATAQTHLLNELVADVFNLLHEAGARSWPDLQAWLSEDGTALDAEESASLAGIIDDLIQLGLVERSPS